MNTREFIEYAERELQTQPGKLITLTASVIGRGSTVYYLDKNGWRWEYKDKQWRILGRG